MNEKIYQTPCGGIHYWINEKKSENALTLVFLPGLTADHRLFDKQIQFFENRYRCFVWDAPGHAASYPFRLDFDLMDKARWLREILDAEGITRPILIGQSMGGYVGQAFAQQFPHVLTGFVSIDSAPLQRKYVSGWEIWLLRRMEPVYRYYPWKLLLKQGTEGVAVTEYGRKLMRDIMMVYDGDLKRYAALAGHGYRMLADAMAADLPYRIPCPALLLCGEKDAAASTKSYNKKWEKDGGIPMKWIPNAGHNSNTDQPELVNGILEDFVGGLAEKDNA